MAKRMEDAALSFHDCLVLATKSSDKMGSLREADFHLERRRPAVDGVALLEDS